MHLVFRNSQETDSSSATEMRGSSPISLDLGWEGTLFEGSTTAAVYTLRLCPIWPPALLLCRWALEVVVRHCCVLFYPVRSYLSVWKYSSCR